MKSGHRHGIGVVQEFLQVGFSGFFGMGASALCNSSALAAVNAQGLRPRAKSLILVFLTGAAQPYRYL